MQFAVKMCFLLFFFRLSETQLFLQFLWAIIGFHMLSTIAIWLLYSLQCRPLKAFYAPELYPDAKCLSTTMFVPRLLDTRRSMLTQVQQNIFRSLFSRM